MTAYDDFLAELPAERRARIAARAKQLDYEAKVRKSTTPNRPTALRTKAAGAGTSTRLARLELRGNLSINALRRQVEAIGGRLRIVVEPKGRAAVELRPRGPRGVAAE